MNDIICETMVNRKVRFEQEGNISEETDGGIIIELTSIDIEILQDKGFLYWPKNSVHIHLRKSSTEIERQEQAKFEMQKLVKLGFADAKIPIDVTDIVIQLLKVQVFYAEEKYLEGDVIASDVAKEMEIPSSKLAAFYNLRNSSDKDKDIKKTIANQIVFFLADKHNKQRKDIKKRQLKNRERKK